MAGNSSNSRPGGSKKVSDKTQGEVRQDIVGAFLDICENYDQQIELELKDKINDLKLKGLGFVKGFLDSTNTTPEKSTTSADDSPEEEEKP